MNTHFILSGGSGGINSYYTIDFYRNIANVFTKKDLKVLSIPYAGLYPKLEPKIQARLVNQTSTELHRTLSYVNPHKTFSVEQAPILPLGTASKDWLLETIDEVDILFAHGGDGDLLQDVMSQFNLSKLVKKDKVCAGFSAGCNMWVDSYYSNDNRRVCDGLGLVSIKTFCHYDWYKFDELNTLIQHKPELPVYPLTNDAYIHIS